MRVLVATSAHRGDDARIAFRQLEALLAAGCEVVYVAPEPQNRRDAVERVVVRRSTGRKRIRSWWQVAVAVHRHRCSVDLILLHDLELVLPVRLTFPRVPVVWDVHEDLVASVADRPWIPSVLRRPARVLTALVEYIARRGTKLILAETSYAERLGPWPVVPNSTLIPRELSSNRVPGQVIYVGRLSTGRGVQTMVTMAEVLGDEADVVFVGSADPGVENFVQTADRKGTIRWLGPLANPDALALVERSVVGLCLLEDLPNYTNSMPTKIYEYFARGVPVVTTDLPLAAQAVAAAQAGIVVGFGDSQAAADAVRAYLADSDRVGSEGESARQWVRSNHDWDRDGRAFVSILHKWSGHAGGSIA